LAGVSEQFWLKKHAHIGFVGHFAKLRDIILLWHRLQNIRQVACGNLTYLHYFSKSNNRSEKLNRRPQQIRNPVRQSIHLRTILTFHHHANHGLGA
jgi:hypothetical protein